MQLPKRIGLTAGLGLRWPDPPTEQDEVLHEILERMIGDPAHRPSGKSG